MIVLDTNVVSELIRARGEPLVVAWVDEHPAGEIYLTAVTSAELRYGVARLPDGHRKTDLGRRIERTLAEDFAGRILPFDGSAAIHYADIVAHRERRGRQISMADAQIAAICRQNGALIATRNTEDFIGTGIVVHNPWTPSAPD